MKKKFTILGNLFLFSVSLFITSPSWAQCDIPAATSTPNYPPALIDEMTGQPLSSSATKCIVLVHGWNPGVVANMYDLNNGFEFFELINNLKLKLRNTGWSIVAYDWHQDAATGSIWDLITDTVTFNPIPPNQAVANAHLHGDNLATMLDNAAPNLREVQFIAHSAGTHAAKEAMIQMLQLNPYVIVQATFLDPYIPCPSDSLGTFSDYAMNELQFATGNDRIQRLENYFANDDPTHGWNAFPWGVLYGPTVNTQETFNWRSSPTPIDINQKIDWGATLHNPAPLANITYSANYDWHAGPIQFYADTVDASITGHTPSTSLPTGSPYDYRNIGWNRSLYAWEAYLPQIIVQPADQVVPSGGSVTLSISVSQAVNIDWYVYSGNWVGSGTTLTLNNFTATNPRLYVARVSNNNGQLYSRAVLITAGAAVAPVITTVSPSTLTGLPIGQRQPIRVIGSSFTSSSTLVFNDGSQNYNSSPAQLTFVSPNELDYNISTGTNQANWTVQVVNGSQTSNLGHFTVNAPSASTGSLVVNLSPAGAISAGAQWQVDGTGYNSSGQVVGYLTTGSHTVSFKPISGYATPANQIVTINANAQTATSATYTANAPSTYALTLNQGGTGSIVPSPFGTWNGSAYIYNADATVQLTANANIGYHFTGWSGDVSGNANPILITINGNKTIGANFAYGDPNMGILTVTIQPPEAAAAGVTWGFNDNDFRASGSSLQYWPGTYFIFIHGTNGWWGGGGWATVTAGQTTNVSFAASSTTGNLIGSDPRTYFTLAGLATNAGSADGVGSAARFYNPWSPVIDSAGNIYVVDVWNDLIRKITPNGLVSTFAGQAGVQGSADAIVGTNATFNNPYGLVIDSSNNLYVADTGNYIIRKITPAGAVSTLAGSAGNPGSANGTGNSAQFNFPLGVAADTNGNVYVAEGSNEDIRKITPAGVVTTFAGLAGSYGTADGTGSAARFNWPSSLTIDANGNLFVADNQNSTIRKVTSAGVVTTIAGFPRSGGAADGTGNVARFYNPNGLAVDAAGNIYVADTGNNAIRKVTQAGVVTTLAGQSGNPGSADGIGSVVRFKSPTGVAIDNSGNLFITDAQNYTIRATQPLTTKVDQFITFAPLPDKSARDAPFSLSATTSSGLRVYLNVLSGPAVLDTNNVLTLLGGGTVNVIAWQPGNSNYNAATPVLQSFNVSKIPQTITFGPLSQQKVGDAPFSLFATSDSVLPVSFSVSGPAVLNGNILTLVNWGTVTVTASQSGNGSYASATNVVQSFFVIPPDNTIVGPQWLPNGNFQLAFYGLMSSNYAVQTSTNLIDWQTFSNFTGSNLLFYFNDSTATNFKQRFYRVTPWSVPQGANTYAATLVRSSNQFFSAPDSPSLSVTGDMTIEAWVKPASQPSSGSYTIVSKSNESGGQESFGLRYFNNNGTNVLDAWIDGNPPHATIAKTIPTGQWTHIAMVYFASAGSITFYVNGVQAGATQTGLANSIYDSTAAFLIGSYDDGVPSTLFDGEVDDVRLWATARTQAQISSTMTSELSGSEPNLRAYWKLDNTLSDSTANGNTLLNNNSATFENTDRPF
jgi:sugar lactone lactonase YvrE